MSRTAILIFVFILIVTAFAQENNQTLKETDSTNLRNLALKVFLDCQTICDIDFIKCNITFVNYVRDRFEADIHLFITGEFPASGGIQYSVEFKGQKEYKDINFELECFSPGDDTQDERRERLVKIIKQGLIPFVSRTPLAENISISYKEPTFQKEVIDKWNSWVFSLYFSGSINGSKNLRGLSTIGSIGIKRVTEAQKITFDSYIGYTESEFTLTESKILNISRSYNATGLFVYSISDHLSTGGWFEYSTSRFKNRKYRFSISPAFEFSLFPYTEHSKREITLLYLIKTSFNNYYEETIYWKTSETLFLQSLEMSVSYTQPWGYARILLYGSHYFHDFKKNHLYIDGYINYRLFSGFSIYGSVGYSMIHDQLSLPKGGASDEEILTRQRELETSYSFYTIFGLSYQFGSIYSNVVNPRF